MEAKEKVKKDGGTTNTNAVWLLIVVGLFFMFFGLIVGLLFPSAVWLLWIGTLLVVGGLIGGFLPGGTLRKERIIDNWNALIDEACIENGDTQTPDKLYTDISTSLDASEAPNLRVEREHLAPSMMRELAGDRREFLVLTDTTNSRIKPYQIYMSARPYGMSLACDWYMTYKPTPLMALLSLIPYVNIIPQSLADIDLFDQQDLQAYATNAHHCMLKAVTELMEHLHQDPSTLNRQSKGFFGVN
jgi:hypothetical protein